jgi:CheY-like chemotaxis protein
MPQAFPHTFSPEAAPDGSQHRVLVIDDSALIRAAASLALSAVPGWEVMLAESGEEGLLLADAERPDAILLDVVMPGMDGLAVADELQARGVSSACKIVLLTGMDGLEEPQRAVPQVAGVIAKPFAVEALAGQLASLLGWRL